MEATKRCSRCGEVKPTTDYYRDRSRSDGLQNYCKPCDNARKGRFRSNNQERESAKRSEEYKRNKDKEREHGRAWYRKNSGEAWFKEKGRAWRLNFKYGLTIEALQSLIKGQDNKCKCCGIEMDAYGSMKGERSPVVDHCHETNMVRGIICSSCNSAEGHIRDRAHLISLGRYMFGKKWKDSGQLALFGKN